MVTVQSAENALKSLYLGAITELLNVQSNALLSKIEHTSSDVWGKEIRKAAALGINGGIGAGDETGDLPQPCGNRYLQFVSTLKNLYGQIEISDKAIRASANGKGAFVDLLNAELESLVTASRFNLSRMLYGDGTGKVGRIATTGPLMVDDTTNLIEGLCVDIYKNGELFLKNFTFTSVDRTNRQVKFDKTGSHANNDFLYVQGSKDKEITGLGAITAQTGSIYGLDRALYPSLKSYVKNHDKVLDETLIQEVIDFVELGAGVNINFIACAADVKYAYQEYMAQFKRNIDIMELNGGFKTMSYNGVPLVYDRAIEKGTMYLLDTNDFKMHQLCDWRFLETENGNILRQTQGKAAYTATLVKYCDLMCNRPNGVAKITNIKRA